MDDRGAETYDDFLEPPARDLEMEIDPEWSGLMHRRDMIKFKDEYLARVANIGRPLRTCRSACPYFFLLSLFPFLIFSITLLGHTSIKADDVIDL